MKLEKLAFIEAEKLTSNEVNRKFELPMKFLVIYLIVESVNT